MVCEKPKCACCDSDKFIHIRSGGGYRCERCKTIFDAYGRVVGSQNYREVSSSNLNNSVGALKSYNFTLGNL